MIFMQAFPMKKVNNNDELAEDYSNLKLLADQSYDSTDVSEIARAFGYSPNKDMTLASHFTPSLDAENNRQYELEEETYSVTNSKCSNEVTNGSPMYHSHIGNSGGNTSHTL